MPAAGSGEFVRNLNKSNRFLPSQVGRKKRTFAGLTLEIKSWLDTRLRFVPWSAREGVFLCNPDNIHYQSNFSHFLKNHNTLFLIF